MKKLFFMLITLFIIYLGIQLLFGLFSKGDNNAYIIEKGNISFEIQERSYFLNKNNNYSYNIKAPKNEYNFQINKDYYKNSQILIDIEYYTDSKYECILPIFKNNTLAIDMMCNVDGNLNYYHDIKGKNKNLDSFVSKIEGYDIYKFTDNTQYEKIEELAIYKENLIPGHFIGITNYKGIYLISDNFNSVVYDISLYDNNIYEQKISAFVDNYYISADYNKKQQFNKFNVVDVAKFKDWQISSDYPISLNSYIQGIVDDIVYLYDKDNKTQYEINISKELVIPYTGNNIKYYKEGTWTTMTVEQANREIKFTEKNQIQEDKNYARIDRDGDEVGYYYLYKKNGNSYDVYSKDIQNENSLVYLFNTKSIDAIDYVDNNVYFINGNKLQVYNREYGIRTLVQHGKLESNKDIKINVFSK